MPAVANLSLPLSGILRLLEDALPAGRLVEGESPLEITSQTTQPPRLISAAVVEGSELRARRVFDPPVVGVAAFLDGVQKSVVVRYLDGGIPIVFGTVAAVIRERRNSRLFTWRHAVDRRFYAPRSLLSVSEWSTLGELGIPVVDTTEGEEPSADNTHPFALRESAVHRVQEDREALEQTLALEWCNGEERTLLIDGGISNAESVARARCAVGVVKSHRTLYASGPALTTVLGLGVGERSSVFLVTSAKRTSVASWYLRLRDPRGHDPMWGLVRVEVAASSDTGLTERADEVARWILAEGFPVALPDGRWDKMVYGVRDCEEFLRAIV